MFVSFYIRHCILCIVFYVHEFWINSINHTYTGHMDSFSSQKWCTDFNFKCHFWFTMQCPSSLRVSSLDLWPSLASVILVQRLWSFCYSCAVEWCIRFLSGWESRRMATWMLFWSFWRLAIVFHTLGWCCVKVINARFEAFWCVCQFSALCNRIGF